MRKFYILLYSIITSLCCSAQKGFGYQVRGSLNGLNNDSIILLINNHNVRFKGDTLFTIAKNNHFYFEGHCDNLYDASIRLGGLNARKVITLFIEKGVIKVNGTIDSLDNVYVTGTRGNDEYTANKISEDRIYTSIRNYQTQLKQLARNKEEETRISNKINSLRESIKTERIKFISTHSNSPASAIYLYVLQDQLSVEKLEAFYTNLSPAIKNLSYVKMIPEKIQARKQTTLGKMAPEFSATDFNGKKFNLSDYRGNYVLLEFWASWCVPCRLENPDLLKTYNTYKDKRFVIIGISLDDKKEKWEKAILEDQLPWIHVSDLNAFNNRIAKLYGVQPIPDNFLIDPKGQIISRQLSGKEVAEKLNREIIID